MPASRIFRFARTSRWASVGSGTRKARAISGVERPPSVRSVRATRASIASAGWQHVKISRNRSSEIGLIPDSPSMAASGSIAASSSAIAASCLRSSCFSASRFLRRSRSIARFRAVVVIQAPGLSGTPRTGHVSSAVTNASWTASSARSKSPRTRMSVATARPCSSRKRRSTMACGSVDGANVREPSGQPVAPTASGFDPSAAPKSKIGRTSIEPCFAPGIFAATSIASSRSLALIR